MYLYRYRDICITLMENITATSIGTQENDADINSMDTQTNEMDSNFQLFKTEIKNNTYDFFLKSKFDNYKQQLNFSDLIHFVYKHIFNNTLITRYFYNTDKTKSKFD